MKEPGEGRAVDSEGGKRLRKEIISFSERPNVVMTAAQPGPWRWAPEQEQFQQSGGVGAREAPGFVGACEEDSRGTPVDPKY